MLTDREFQRIRDFVHQHLGILWNSSKKDLVYTRLRKRLLKLGMSNFGDYADYLFAPEGHLEVQVMINSITTNKTNFFREKPQFEFLEQEFFPSLKKNRNVEEGKKIRIWSAACSTGEEAYNLALLASEGLVTEGLPGWDIKILASDIDTSVLETAKAGVYTQYDVVEVPKLLLKKYFNKETRRGQSFYKVKDSLKNLIQFRPINFLDESYPINTQFDLIFCRNVLIYFDIDNQQAVLRHLNHYLRKGGYLFLGGSEILGGLTGFRRLKNSIYQKTAVS